MAPTVQIDGVTDLNCTIAANPQNQQRPAYLDTILELSLGGGGLTEFCLVV